MQAFSQPASVSADCHSTYKRALQLIQEYDTKLSSEDQRIAHEVIERSLKKGASAASGYNEYGGGEMMKGKFIAAAWGSLKAATLEWNPTHVGNVGIYLSYLNRFDDAEIFLQCAGNLTSHDPFVIEGKAMLAYRKKDYSTAMKLIEQAVRMMPGDMNVLYSAGVIFYKAGDRARAKQYLEQAKRIAPQYKTIIEALKVVDPSGQTTPGVNSDSLSKLVQECFQFMDHMLARGEAIGKYVEEIKVIEGTSDPRGAVGGDIFETMRVAVLENKKEITILEARVRRKENTAKTVDWNATLQACITAYLTTTVNYQQIINDKGVDLIIAQAMDIAATRLVERLKRHDNGNSYRYVILDEKFKYYLVEEPAREIFKAGYKRCEGRDDHEACIKPYRETYCSTVIPVWQGHWKNVAANMSSIESGYPAAINDYAKRWNRLTNYAAEYCKRAISTLRPIPDGELKMLPPESRAVIISVSTPQAYANTTRKLYDNYFGSMTSFIVEAVLSMSHFAVIDALDTAPAAFLHSAFYTDECYKKQPEKGNLDLELEKLINAFKEASEYEPNLQPECELEIGDWKTTYKPFSSDNSPDLENSNVKITVDPANNRWGGEFGSDVATAETNYGPLRGELSVKFWAEGNIVGGQLDYGVQLEGKVGLGLKKKGIGGFGCYIPQTYKFNARAFGAALTR